MPIAIILGSSLAGVAELQLRADVVKTDFGRAMLFQGTNRNSDLYVIVREGIHKEIAPHQINFRANLKALEERGVKRIISIYEVGSISLDIPPRSVSVMGDFIDFAHGRGETFFEGGDEPVRHVDMSTPFCPAMSQKLIDSGPEFDFIVRSNTLYVATHGTRLSTAAEINMFRRMGGEVVGMSAIPEVPLIRELGMSVAGLTYSIGWATGIQNQVEPVEEGIGDAHTRLFNLALHTLRATSDQDCNPAAIH